MALLQLFHNVRRDCAAEFSTALDGQTVDHTELYLAGLHLVCQQNLQRVLCHAGDHRADAVAAAHADDELVQLGVINKIVLRLHIHDTLALALYHCFEFIQNRLVDRHNFVLLYQLILF